MGLPERDEARNWVGRTVVDREGVELGACTAVLADEATGVPEWFYVEVEGVSAVVRPWTPTAPVTRWWSP